MKMLKYSYDWRILCMHNGLLKWLVDMSLFYWQFTGDVCE